jgi:SAM-dependent methyltransferase
MSDEIKQKWNERYRGAGAPGYPAVEVLAAYSHLLPKQGKALEIACGLGANALILDEHGLQTTAWDISSVAIERLAAEANGRGLAMDCEARDVVNTPPAANSFDVIIVSYFLDRALIPHIRRALRRNGLVFYQTYIRDKVSDAGPGNPDFRLTDNELLTMFSGYRILLYREEGRVGELATGYRDEAMLIAQKISDE